MQSTEFIKDFIHKIDLKLSHRRSICLFNAGLFFEEPKQKPYNLSHSFVDVRGALYKKLKGPKQVIRHPHDQQISY